MERIVLASNNKHKVEEFRKILNGLNIETMEEIGFLEDIAETGTTFSENAYLKAKAVWDFCKKNGIVATVLADDSGLCVDALGGAPGVYTARFGGDHDPVAGRKHLLEEMKGKKDRRAYFECAIAKIAPDGKCEYAHGRTYGKITEKEIGEAGMTFDRLFLSDDLHKTFSQATMEEKNSVSHRARALDELKAKWKI